MYGGKLDQEKGILFLKLHLEECNYVYKLTTGALNK